MLTMRYSTPNDSIVSIYRERSLMNDAKYGENNRSQSRCAGVDDSLVTRTRWQRIDAIFPGFMFHTNRALVRMEKQVGDATSSDGCRRRRNKQTR